MKVGSRIVIAYCEDKDFQEKSGTILQEESFRGDVGEFTGWSIVMDDDGLNNFYCEENKVYVNEYVFRSNELFELVRNTKLARKMYSEKKVSECGGYLV